MAKSFDLFLLVDFDAPVVELAVEIRLGNTRPCLSQVNMEQFLEHGIYFDADGRLSWPCLRASSLAACQKLLKLRASCYLLLFM